jgi:hypothetical protein
LGPPPYSLFVFITFGSHRKLDPGRRCPRQPHSMDADRTPSLLQRCWVVDGKQPSGKIKVLYDSAVQKLLDEVGLSLLDAANKSEWHNIRLARHPGFQPKLPPNGPLTGRLLSPKGLLYHPYLVSRAAASGASVTASATCEPESRRNLKPTKPAIEISDADRDRKRKILITPIPDSKGGNRETGNPRFPMRPGPGIGVPMAAGRGFPGLAGAGASISAAARAESSSRRRLKRRRPASKSAGTT